MELNVFYLHPPLMPDEVRNVTGNSRCWENGIALQLFDNKKRLCNWIVDCETGAFIIIRLLHFMETTGKRIKIVAKNEPAATDEKFARLISLIQKG